MSLETIEYCLFVCLCRWVGQCGWQVQVCVSHMYVQLVCQKSSGSLSLSPPGWWNRRSHPGMGHKPLGIPYLPLQAHNHSGPGITFSLYGKESQQTFKKWLNPLFPLVLLVWSAVCGGPSCEGGALHSGRRRGNRGQWRSTWCDGWRRWRICRKWKHSWIPAAPGSRS